MSSIMSQPITHVTRKRTWENWPRSFEIRVKQLIDVWNPEPERSTLSGYVTTTKGLQELLGRALKAKDEVRAFGGGWSYSPVAATHGIMLNTKPLNYRFSLGPSAVSAEYAGDSENLVFLQCGNSIAELNRYLASDGKVMKPAGTGSGQTIAGAMSTGTHGGAIDMGAVSDYVVAMHLIVSPTRHVWLERASNPVIVDGKLPEPLGADVIRDDAIFNAALVSLGSFGIIHGVVLEVENGYFLNAFRRKMPFDKQLRDMMEDLDFSRLNLPRPHDRPFYYHVLMNPSELTGEAYVTTMYRDSERMGDLPPPPSKIGLGDDGLGVIGVLTDLSRGLSRALVQGLTAIGYGEYENYGGTPGQIFRDTTTRGKTASTALGIPLQHVNDALDVLFQLHEKVGAPVLFGCRYVKSTTATLGFTNHGERTCVLEIDGPQSSKVTTLFKRAWKALHDAGIPFTCHWGKQHDLNEERVREMYGEKKIDAWIHARHQLLPTPELRKMFANDHLKRLGMAG